MNSEIVSIPEQLFGLNANLELTLLFVCPSSGSCSLQYILTHFRAFVCYSSAVMVSCESRNAR